jgi:hypothetical protein
MIRMNPAHDIINPAGSSQISREDMSTNQNMLKAFTAKELEEEVKRRANDGNSRALANGAIVTKLEQIKLLVEECKSIAREHSLEVTFPHIENGDSYGPTYYGEEGSFWQSSSARC